MTGPVVVEVVPPVDVVDVVGELVDVVVVVVLVVVVVVDVPEDVVVVVVPDVVLDGPFPAFRPASVIASESVTALIASPPPHAWRDRPTAMSAARAIGRRG